MATRPAPEHGSIDPPCYTLDEFLQTHRIARSTYYELRGRGETPREIRAGRKVLISAEAAREWRERMAKAPGARPASERESAAGAAPLTASRR